MKASEVIGRLVFLISIYGDREVLVGNKLAFPIGLITDDTLRYTKKQLFVLQQNENEEFSPTIFRIVKNDKPKSMKERIEHAGQNSKLGRKDKASS